MSDKQFKADMKADAQKSIPLVVQKEDALVKDIVQKDDIKLKVVLPSIGSKIRSAFEMHQIAKINSEMQLFDEWIMFVKEKVKTAITLMEHDILDVVSQYDKLSDYRFSFELELFGGKKDDDPHDIPLRAVSSRVIPCAVSSGKLFAYAVRNVDNGNLKSILSTTLTELVGMSCSVVINLSRALASNYGHTIVMDVTLSFLGVHDDNTDESKNSE